MVELLFLFGTIFLLAAIVTRIVFGGDRRRASYAAAEPEILSWKHAKE